MYTKCITQSEIIINIKELFFCCAFNNIFTLFLAVSLRVGAYIMRSGYKEYPFACILKLFQLCGKRYMTRQLSVANDIAGYQNGLYLIPAGNVFKCGVHNCLTFGNTPLIVKRTFFPLFACRLKHSCRIIVQIGYLKKANQSNTPPILL